MNILIPHSWLLEHLETFATPEEIQREVSLCGPSIERIYDREGEAVYDIEVTTNRVDSMSVRGVAREAAIILTQAGFPSKLKPLTVDFHDFSQKAAGTNSLPLPKITNNPQLSSRILCIVLQNVERTATPDWMAKRLRQVELNVHDSVIDITNYVTHELGHPCHAFDYDRLMALGGEIIVKVAEPGKKFTTLDGVSYETLGGEVVYENPQGEIIDLPAIKGTANTSIDESTKNILFWIETIEAKKVRQASMGHSIRTVAAQLNEKKVDPFAAEPVFAKAVQLYQELCHAQIGSSVYDDFPGKRPLSTVTFPLADIERYLGITLSLREVEHILRALECEVRMDGETAIITPPSFRPDIEISADVVEELARIYGYHRLPSKIMDTAIPTTFPENEQFQLEHRLKRSLAEWGWQELYTYSMVSAEVAIQSGFSLDEHLKLQNPLTEDRAYLRRSLLPSLAEIIELSTTPKPASVFEFALTYTPQANSLPTQKMQVSLVTHRSYRELRGVIDALFARLFLTNHQLRPLAQATGWHQAAEIICSQNGDTITIGMMGVLTNGLRAATLNWPFLLKVAKTHPKYQALSTTMPVIEDLTFTIPIGTAIGQLMEEMKDLSPQIGRVELKDQYERNFTFTVHYQDMQKNLTAEEVEELRRKLIQHAIAQQATLVGAINA